MLKAIKFGLIAAACLALTACNTVGANMASGINAVTAALASPNATLAAQNLRIGATAFVCNVSSVAGVVMAGVAIDGKQAALIDPKSALAQVYNVDSTVLAVSSAVCAAMSGTVGGSAQITAISGTIAAATAPVGPSK